MKWLRIIIQIEGQCYWYLKGNFLKPKASDVIVEKWLKLYFKRLFHDFKRWLQWNLMLFFVDNTFITFNQLFSVPSVCFPRFY